MQLVFASNNKNKITEIQQLVPQHIKVLSLEDIGCDVDIPETADTIEGNAILKASYVTEHYGYPCFADDSGLEVHALNGEPGVISARYAGSHRNNDDNINKVLDKLSNETNRRANFKTVIALHINSEEHLFTGIINGTIITEKRGTNGFGYDPVFVPDGYTKTFAEFTLDEKSAISHRGIAVKQLVSYLETL
ncbi:non-canonical purine NTP diphosphatase [Flavobacterium amniphilum]|uniref:non-canonical purine NTP diphosphatase n=1 Tax=Flavobacterium amniphilum TaxID=1834035 RepID=UPI002029EEAA|nr:non-canonical purine NTP diphosphatase [Flavobacterium amniphilum]MCL9807270.1 non-canonical purine NTP diphosphatase [Flavobacterium amniphilum]